MIVQRLDHILKIGFNEWFNYNICPLLSTKWGVREASKLGSVDIIIGIQNMTEL